MKSFKYLLVLPFAITALASCNKGNFSPTTPENAIAMVENYAKSIKNSKASSITVGGHINEIKLKGDATWWSLAEPEFSRKEKLVVVGEDPVPVKREQKVSVKLGLLSMIPNFSVEDSEIVVDPQDIVSFTLPGSMISLGDSSIPADQMAIITAANLPKFPMNNNLLKAIRGLDKLPQGFTKEAWDATTVIPWKEAEVKFYTDGGRLKITVETKDVEAFFNEIAGRYGDSSFNADPEPTKKYPGSFSITTNKIGYIDSLSVSFKIDGAKYKSGYPDSELYYAYLNGDLSFDFGLTFKQTISDPVTLKYQLSAYHETKGTENPDIEYSFDDGKTYTRLTYDKDKSIPLTSSLKDLEKYLTFDWYKNVGKDDEKDPVLIETFDDPIFCCNYWNDNEKNIAFTNEIYDVLAIPILDSSSNPKCAILGGEMHPFGEAPKKTSYVTTSINGRLVSENGLLAGNEKLLNSAGDAVQTIKKDKDNILMDEIFINSNLIDADGAEYIVNISVMVPEEK